MISPVAEAVLSVPDPDYEAMLVEARAKGLKFYSEENEIDDVSCSLVVLHTCLWRFATCCKYRLLWLARHACTMPLMQFSKPALLKHMVS